MSVRRNGIRMRATAVAAILACCSFANALPLIGALQLQGSAVYSQLQRDYFIAEVYGNDSMANTSSTQLMQVTVLTGEWSKRSFYQYWAQAVAINNDAATVAALDSDLEAFKSIIKGSLKEGDQLVISRRGLAKTVVSLNTIELLQTSSDKLFVGLLQSWIGPRPPSSQFKAEISGASPGQTLPEAAVSSETRAKEIRAWLAPAKTTAKASAASGKAAPSPTGTGVLDSTKQPSARNSSLELATLAAPAAQAKSKHAAAVTQAKAETGSRRPAGNIATAHIPTVTPATSAKKVSSPIYMAAQQTPALQAAPSAQGVATSATTGQAGTKPAGPESSIAKAIQTKAGDIPQGSQASAIAGDSTADSGLLRVYRSNLLKLTYQNLIYPTGAINRNQQGKVILQVTLNRQGKVKD
ncbi:MAG: hypothetical protein HKO71_03325, partial [Pseudomonadales bacterium]|nr:hypothetical protein [Pseudomonadales bacterium]